MTGSLRHAVLLGTFIAAGVLAGCNLSVGGDGDPGGTGSPGTGGTGSTGGSGTGAATYSIGGNISGLTQSGLSLTASGNTASVAAGASAFTLPNLLAAGASYTVSVHSQPTGQTCAVANASGTVAQANVDNVQVTCTDDTYSIGGIITGLNASGLVLANGTDMLTVPIGTSAFVLPTKLAMGAAYAVSVQTQPVGLNCQVINGTNVMPPAAVTNVVVACGEWSWMGGSASTGAAGTYGMQGIAAPANVPAARAAAVSWTDHAGNLWLFGGSASGGQLNDLWKYVPGGEWTWVGGSSAANAAGHYGSPGSPAAGNFPGARASATSWVDATGNLWLFGGQGYDSADTSGSLDDLWMYNVTRGLWTWEAGEDTAAAAGATPPTNEPGGRTGAAAWADSAGDLWLFGGMGTLGLTNDLWEFVSGTGWALIAGTQAGGTLGIYGTQGTAAMGNTPGGRTQAAASIDAAGNLWLFGGSGYGAVGGTGELNDLWEFDRSSSQWVWMGGWKTVDAAGVYGTRSTTDVPLPGARSAAAAVSDASGNLWLFGGSGYDAAGKQGPLNDLWEYDVSAARWVWMGGSQSNSATGVYGTQGTGAPANGPGARSGALAWMDGSGNLWLFGGQGLATAKTGGPLNDLWQFAP